MVERMLYRRYKTSFSDCEVIPGTYDKATKTIDLDHAIKRLERDYTSYKFNLEVFK